MSVELFYYYFLLNHMKFRSKVVIKLSINFMVKICSMLFEHEVGYDTINISHFIVSVSNAKTGPLQHLNKCVQGGPKNVQLCFET